MGTYLAGATLLNRAIGFVTLNGVGIFVWGYAAMFLPPAGDSVRVVLKDPVRAAEVRTMLGSGVIGDPVTGLPVAAGRITADTWYATGAALDSGRCFEIRFDNPESVRLHEERENLSHEREVESARAAFDLDRAAAAERLGRLAQAEKLRKSAGDMSARVAELDANISSDDAKLVASSGAFSAAVLPHFREAILPDGAEILSARKTPGTILTFQLVRRPSVNAQEKMLDSLRASWPAVIDLRPVVLGGGYGLALSLAGTDPGLVQSLEKAVETEASRRMPDALASGPPQEKPAEVLTLDLLIVEDPLDRHPSPITRVVNSILGWFDAAPREQQRLGALGRTLRTSVASGHAGLNSSGDHSLAVSIVLEGGGDKVPEDGVSARLSGLLGNPEDVARARMLYDNVVRNGASQRITVARPVVSSGFVKRKYDYMSGYLWMFALGIIGLSITYAFVARERRGLIHKRGLEESEQS